MKRMLSEVPIWEIQIGDRVIGHTGTPGRITIITPRCLASQAEDHDIHIEWDNGKASLAWHYWMNHVEYCEQEQMPS